MSIPPISEQTLVITGATSGIGLSTALDAARRGARLVLVARDAADLDAAAEQCRALGAEVETVAADVGERGALDAAAARAVERFGGFDTWVNNAGVSIYGDLRDVPEDDARRLFDTNYWGTVHGSLVAAAHFRTRSADRPGVLVNVGSVLSDRAIPLQGHYCASKHAVKGFTDALRMELAEEGVPARVVLVKPSAIDTPYVEHAGNYMDVEGRLPTPAYAPDVVAAAILRAAEHPQRSVTVGGKDGLLSVFGQFAPKLTDRIMEATFFGQQRGDGPAPADRQGTLHAPDGTGGRERGGADGHVFESSLYTTLKQHPAAALGAAAVAAGVAVAVANRKK
jgi:short-subunit dehydrogenase